MDIGQDLSIQLHTFRDHGDLARSLAALAALGFRRVETVGLHLADARATRAALDAAGIEAPTGHVAMEDLRARPDWVAEQARIVGIAELFMPALPPGERAAPAPAWRRVGAELGALALRLGAAGLALGYHNHDWELRPFPDGTTPLAHLFAGAAGAPLGFQADLAWLVRGGADPVAWMEAERARLSAVHVKDLAPPGRNADEEGWATIGSGTLDWPRLWREAVARGARHMVLEHDRPKDPVGFARESRAFLMRALAVGGTA